MICKEVIQLLEAQSPLSYACEWDNVGLLAGREEKEVQRIYVALDATDEVIDAAIEAKADMLLTHHPLIFKGLKRVVAEDFIGRRLIRLIQNDVAYYAMHTNYDVKGMAALSAAMLGLKDAKVLDVTTVVDGREEGIGRIGLLEGSIRLEALAKQVQEKFSIDKIKVFGNPQELVQVAAISPGSGKSEIGNAINKGAQVLITGDIDHHEGLDAVAQGLSIIDAGHYGLEQIFVQHMKEYLEEKTNGIGVITQKQTFPFWII